MVAHTREPSFVELFTPKLLTVLQERYRFEFQKLNWLLA